MDFIQKRFQIGNYLNIHLFLKLLILEYLLKRERAGNICQRIFKSIEDENVEMYGPMKSLVYRVKDRFRYNIFIKGSKRI